MKKINLIGYLSIALVFIFISCNSEEGLLEINEKSSNQQTICGDEKVVDLIAGQHINVGTVTVSNDETNLYVTYNATGDWSITETHLYVGPESDIPLTKSGNPKFGHFPLHGDSEDPFVIPLADLGDSFVVVAHAVVDRIVNGESVQNETAFGCGDKEFPGNRWGCYFDYEKQECEEEEECIDVFGYKKPEFSYCFLDDGFEQWGWSSSTNYNILRDHQNTNGNFTMPLLYMNDSECNYENGIEVGYIEFHVFLEDNKYFTSIKYVITDDQYKLNEVNFYLGTEKYPIDGEGNPSVSPSEYINSEANLNTSEMTFDKIMWPTIWRAQFIYFIPHAKICKVD